MTSLSQTTEIAIVPIQLEFDVKTNCLTIHSSFNGKNYQDHVTKISDNEFDISLTNCLNFIEYKIVQKHILTETSEMTDSIIQYKIEEDFKGLIHDLLTSVLDIKENAEDKNLKHWKHEASLVVYERNAGVYVHLDKVDFLSSGIPLLQELMDEQIGNIKDVYLGRGGVSLVILEENNLPPIIYEI